jgi:Ni/Co efflux regulator RcnB
MKLKLALASAVLACGAFVAGQSVAQNDQHHEEHHAAPQGGQPHGGPPPGGHGPQGGQMHGPQGGPPGGHPGGTMSGPPHGTMMGPSHGGNMTMGHGPVNGGNAMMGHNPAPNRNFDRRTYQRNFNAPRHYHVGVYVRPQGWYAHRWVYGEILPSFFWTQNYWLANYYAYGLADPPPGFVWVRYGDDALLIDQNSGEVLQVEYAVFD